MFRYIQLFLCFFVTNVNWSVLRWWRRSDVGSSKNLQHAKLAKPVLKFEDGDETLLWCCRETWILCSTRFFCDFISGPFYHSYSYEKRKTGYSYVELLPRPLCILACWSNLYLAKNLWPFLNWKDLNVLVEKNPVCQTVAINFMW